jgi:hypothetical protein
MSTFRSSPAASTLVDPSTPMDVDTPEPTLGKDASTHGASTPNSTVGKAADVDGTVRRFHYFVASFVD